MTSIFTDMWETLVPRRDARHGPLPPLLVGLTLVTGLVDAFSYLVLGHVFVATAVLLASVSGSPVSAGFRYPLILALALAMGVQNATARKLAVPDLTTTVLTLTITGIAADSTIAGGAGSTTGRRVVSVTAMLVGAVIGAVFVLHVAVVLPLAVALAVLVAIVTAGRVLGRTDAAWVRP